MKNLILLFIQFLLVVTLNAQSSNLLLKKDAKGYYLDHKVAAKENFYSIGRLYNTHPRHIAGFNNLDMNKGLSLGQMLKIPVSDTNFTQTLGRGVPIFYQPGANDDLSDVSRNARNVSVSRLRHWNKLSDNDKTPPGKLIVGFLVTSEMKNLAVSIPDEPTEEIVERKTVSTDKPKPGEEVTSILIEEKKPEPEVPAPVTVKQVVKPATGGSGYFKSAFEKQVKKSAIRKEQTVTSGIFKTTSGWQDAKYYMLIDKVEPGTIVRVTNPVNNKMVYAKVLYGMEGIRQNQGLDIRISNAAASALDISDTEKFIVTVNW